MCIYKGFWSTNFRTVSTRSPANFRPFFHVEYTFERGNVTRFMQTTQRNFRLHRSLLVKENIEMDGNLGCMIRLVPSKICLRPLYCRSATFTGNTTWPPVREFEVSEYSPSNRVTHEWRSVQMLLDNLLTQFTLSQQTKAFVESDFGAVHRDGNYKYKTRGNRNSASFQRRSLRYFEHKPTGDCDSVLKVVSSHY